MKVTTTYLLLIFLSFLLSCTQQQAEKIPVDSKLNLANAYYTNGLYQAAVKEYQGYVDEYAVDPTRIANTYFTIANIYFDRINDYEKALEYYFKVKYLFPESTLQGEVGKKIVSCLERLQKSTDAARILEQDAALDKTKVAEHRPGQVLAEIGEKKITQGDLDFEISKLPVYVQDQFSDKARKKEFLQQLILQELLYDSAKRQELDKDKDVIEGTFRAQKSLMAEKILQGELKDQVKISPEDVELFYLAHKDRYVEKNDKGEVVRQKELAEAQQQVAQDLALDRQQQAYQRLVERLMKAENVKIFENRVQ